MSVIEIQRRRDPEATRISILDSAEQLFVERGFAATSMSDIAGLAGVTKSLIHHHFGSKEELWKEVKRRGISEFAEAYKRLTHAPIDKDLLRTSVVTFFRFLEKNPNFVRLHAWMNLEDLSGIVRPDIWTLGIERMREAQRRGVLRDDVDAHHILVVVLSLSIHWFMAKNWYSRARLTDSEDPRADDAYLDDMLKVFLEGVLPREPSQ